MEGNEEEKEKKKEAEKKDWTLRELLAKSGGVLDNPFLVEIIEAASSPTAVDNHMVKTLGWPCELGKRMRHAARIRKHFPDEWEKVKKSSVRPAEALFDFDEDIPGTDSDVIIKASSGIRFDEWRNENAVKPFLFKEFRFESKYKPEVFTTFDGGHESEMFIIKGDIPAKFPETGPSSPLWSDRDVFSSPLKYGSIAVKRRPRDNNGEADNNKRASCLHHSVRSRKNKPGYLIAAGTVLQMPGYGEDFLPRLAKLLAIHDPCSGDKIKDSISIMFYADVYPQVQNEEVGSLIFRREVELAARCHAVLTANYYVKTGECIGECYSASCYGRLLSNGCFISVNIEVDHGVQEDNFFRNTDEASATLNRWAEKIYKAGHERAISLEKIAGKSFWDNPPERLIDLFV